MARRKHSELAAGIFVLLALGAGIGVLLWLGAADVFVHRGDRVVFAIPYKSGNLGLAVGSAVKVNDKSVGKVEDMRIDLASGQTLYLARLTDPDITLRSDAHAVAVAEFIGGTSIVLDAFGTADAPPPDERNPIPLEAINVILLRMQEALGYGAEQRKQFQEAIAYVARSAGNVDKITSTLVGELSAKDSAALLARVKAAVEDLKTSSSNLVSITGNLKAETEKKNVSSLLARLDDIARKIQGEVQKSDRQSLLAKVHTSADDVNKVTQHAAGMMKTVRPEVEKTVANVRAYTEKDLAEILVKFRQASTALVNIAADLRAVSATSRDIVVLNRKRIDDTLANLKYMSLNLNAAVKEIRRNPWRLLAEPDEKRTDSENIYDAARAFTEGAAQLDDALTRLAALREARSEGVKADDPELLRIRKHIEDSFEKFQKVEDALWEKLKHTK